MYVMWHVCASTFSSKHGPAVLKHGLSLMCSDLGCDKQNQQNWLWEIIHCTLNKLLIDVFLHLIILIIR